jgi:hypothetical protein
MSANKEKLACELLHFAELASKIVECVPVDFGDFISDELDKAYRLTRRRLMIAIDQAEETFDEKEIWSGHLSVGDQVYLPLSLRFDDDDDPVDFWDIRQVGSELWLNLPPELESACPDRWTELDSADQHLSDEVNAAISVHLERAEQITEEIRHRQKRGEGEKALSEILIDKDFTFISDEELRTVLVRTISELSVAFAEQLHKCTVLLAFSAIESLFQHCLKQDEADARISYHELLKARGNKTSSDSRVKQDVVWWHADVVVNVAFGLNIIPKNTMDNCLRLKGYRNGIHLHYQIRRRLNYSATETTLSLFALNDVVDATKRWLESH